MTTVSNPFPSADARHVPVMLNEVLAALAPADGDIIVDGTFGAGGYTRAVLNAANCTVVAIDRDPDAIRAGQPLAAKSGGRLRLVAGEFADMAALVASLGITHVNGVVLDIGVSSIQLDDGTRGFSFLRDGPLDMRMSQSGPSAADCVNGLEQDALAKVIFVFGEEPRSRAIARAIVAARNAAPIRSTFELVQAIERATGPQRAKDRTHPATRTFQALRIYVNRELDQLSAALAAAEALLAEGGRLVVVTFHSLEDRIVKRFFAHRSGHVPSASRHAPQLERRAPPSFVLSTNHHVAATEAETSKNPRARSAKLRSGIRTASPALRHDPAALGVPVLTAWRH